MSDVKTTVLRRGGTIYILQRAIAGTPNGDKNPRSNGSSLPLQALKVYPCSRCGAQYSGAAKGQKHRACKASPRGRFGVVELVEKK